MSSIGDKVAHVKKARQVRLHTCHWPGCAKQVPPALWGCRPHWYALPAELRMRIWRTYRIGQEADQQPSREYIDTAHEVQRWIAEHLRTTRQA